MDIIISILIATMIFFVALIGIAVLWFMVWCLWTLWYYRGITVADLKEYQEDQLCKGESHCCRHDIEQDRDG